MGGPGDPHVGAMVGDRVPRDVTRSIPARRRLEEEAAEMRAELQSRRRELARLAPETQAARAELWEANVDVARHAETRAHVKIARGEARAAESKRAKKYAAAERDAAEAYAEALDANEKRRAKRLEMARARRTRR